MPRFEQFDKDIEKAEDDLELKNAGKYYRPVKNMYRPVPENKRWEQLFREKIKQTNEKIKIQDSETQENN